VIRAHEFVDAELVRLATGADVLIYDSQYTPEEYRGDAGRSKVGWGHSTWLRGIRLAEKANVKHLCLFHHDPSHDDDFMDALAAEADDVRAGTVTAREGQIIDL